MDKSKVLEFRLKMASELMRSEVVRELIETLINNEPDLQKGLKKFLDKQQKITNKFIKEVPKRAKKLGITL